MAAMAIPKIFYSVWFWYAVMAIIAAIHFFWGKTPPPPKPRNFFTKHKKTINKVTDVCIICFVLVCCFLLLSFSVRQMFDALHAPQSIRAIDLHFALGNFLISFLIISGLSGFYIGLLSVFQSNLTKAKRVILLVISLLPIIFTILVLLINLREPADSWSIIKIGLAGSFCCWLINGPAIIIGKPLSRVVWAALCALRLASGEYPE